MTTVDRERQLLNRLRRIQGQISGIAKMIEQDRYCLEIANQTAAAVAVLRNGEKIVVESTS